MAGSLFPVLSGAGESGSVSNASEFAVNGYSQFLRQDLEIAGSSVAVCCIHPGGVGTDIARRARNTDPSISNDEQQARFEEFVRTSPEDAAESIFRAAAHGQRLLRLGLALFSYVVLLATIALLAGTAKPDSPAT